MQLRGFTATWLHYDKMNDKSTSEGLKEKKLKAPNAEASFVNDLWTY